MLRITYYVYMSCQLRIASSLRCSYLHPRTPPFDSGNRHSLPPLPLRPALSPGTVSSVSMLHTRRLSTVSRLRSKKADLPEEEEEAVGAEVAVAHGSTQHQMMERSRAGMCVPSSVTPVGAASLLGEGGRGKEAEGGEGVSRYAWMLGRRM